MLEMGVMFTILLFKEYLMKVKKNKNNIYLKYFFLYSNNVKIPLL